MIRAVVLSAMLAVPGMAQAEPTWLENFERSCKTNSPEGFCVGFFYGAMTQAQVNCGPGTDWVELSEAAADFFADEGIRNFSYGEGKDTKMVFSFAEMGMIAAKKRLGLECRLPPT